jgi:hypothetical protein
MTGTAQRLLYIYDWLQVLAMWCCMPISLIFFIFPLVMGHPDGVAMMFLAFLILGISSLGLWLVRWAFSGTTRKPWERPTFPLIKE